VRLPNRKQGNDKSKSNSRANSAIVIKGVKGTLFFWRRFFGSWFSRLGGAEIFNFVSLPLAARRSGRGGETEWLDSDCCSDPVSFLEESADF
jgi:hypothetical protein